MMLRLPVLAVVAAAAVCLRGCEAAPLAVAEAAGTGLARRSYYEPIVRAVAEGGRWAKAAFNRAAAPLTGAGKYSVQVSDDAATAAAAGSAAKVTDDFAAAAAGNAAKVADDPVRNLASYLDNANAARFENKVIEAQTNLFNGQFPRSVDDLEESALLAREALDDAVKAGKHPAFIEELTAMAKSADDAVIQAKNPRPIADLEADLFKAKKDLATFKTLDRELAGVRKSFDARVDNLNAATEALLRGQRETTEALAKGTKPPNIEALRAAVEVEELRMRQFVDGKLRRAADTKAKLATFLEAANKQT